MAAKDDKQQIMNMWGVTIVIALAFMILYAVNTFYVHQESEIRRESYLANLQQFYQQEISQCSAITPAGVDEGQEDSSAACLAEVNEDGRYANLLKKWGGEEFLVTE